VHGFESLDTERTGDDGFFGEKEPDVKSIAVRNGLRDIRADNSCALEMEIFEAVSDV
jgi:hypothetical protein